MRIMSFSKSQKTADGINVDSYRLMEKVIFKGQIPLLIFKEEEENVKVGRDEILIVIKVY